MMLIRVAPIMINLFIIVVQKIQDLGILRIRKSYSRNIRHLHILLHDFASRDIIK